jgi:hypothetical protein
MARELGQALVTRGLVELGISAPTHGPRHVIRISVRHGEKTMGLGCFY